MAAPPIAERHLPHFHRRAPVKESCRVATTGNITISTGLNAGDTIDGVTLAAGDRVLVKDQSTGSQNGIYLAGVTPVREYDESTDDPSFGYLVFVREGTTNAGTLWANTNTATPTIGSTALTFDQFTTGGGTSGLAWFNVTDPAYGAVGDGSTNDTSAINLAIAALNTATRGVLYFPAGDYLCSSALTTITAECLVLGDGAQSTDGTAYISRVKQSSTTANLFTVTGKRVKFEHIALECTGSSPSAGAGVSTQGSYICERVSFEDVVARKFFINYDVQVGSDWTMHDCLSVGPKKYGVKIRNTVNGDAGDWHISDCTFFAGYYDSDAAIHAESSGGGTITNCKFNEIGSIDSHRMARCVDVSAGSTSILLISNSSFENYSGDAIHHTSWPMLVVSGCEFGQYGNTTGYAISANVDQVAVFGCHFKHDSSAAYAMNFNSSTRVMLGQFTNSGFNTAPYYTGGTTLFDGSGGIANQVYVTGTPTSGQVPTATSSTAATWQTPAAASLTIKDEGTPLSTGATSLDFVGGLVVASGTGAGKTITIAGALDDLTDVTISSPATAERLRYSGSAWVNSGLIWTPLTVFNGTDWMILVDGSGNAVMSEA